MLVKKKLYSVMDEEGNLGYYLYDESNGEEKLFSVNETLLEGYEFVDEKEFSEKVNLEDVESHRGLKRAIITAPITAGGSLIGGYLSKRAADKLDKEGASDEKIIRGARKRGLEAGAISGAVVGGVASIKGKSALPLVVLPALGALGGSSAAGVNVRDRIAKRALKEREKSSK